MPGSVSSPFPPSCPAFAALRVAGLPVRPSLTPARWYAIPCGLCVPWACSGCPSGIPCLFFACVCARALAASAPFLPPRVGVAAHLALFRCRTPVGPCHALRAPPRFLPRSRALSSLLGGGGGPVPFPPCLAGGRVPPDGRVRAPGAVRRRRGAREGGAACVPSSPGAWPGCPEGRGVALPRSVPLPSLGGHQSGCYRRRSVHRGRGLHTAPVRVRVLAPGVVRVAPLCAGLSACLLWSLWEQAGGGVGARGVLP